jgi:hypothetical protein
VCELTPLPKYSCVKFWTKHNSTSSLCLPVLSSILDRVPETDENWTFGIYSSLYAKGGTQDRLYWTAPFLIKIYDWNYIRNSLYTYKMFYLLMTWTSGNGESFSLRGAMVRDHNNRKFSKNMCLLAWAFITSRCQNSVTWN